MAARPSDDHRSAKATSRPTSEKDKEPKERSDTASAKGAGHVKVNGMTYTVS